MCSLTGYFYMSSITQLLTWSSFITLVYTPCSALIWSHIKATVISLFHSHFNTQIYHFNIRKHMEGQQGSPVDPTTRNNHSRTPLIHVTLPNIPDDQTDDSPYSDSRDEGLDNPAFHRGSIDVTPTLTPQPNLPQNSPMFVFDPECSSLYSRQGSASVYSRRGSSNLDVSNPRTPYAVSRRGSGQPSDKSSLTVPTIVTSKKLYFRYLLICA